MPLRGELAASMWPLNNCLHVKDDTHANAVLWKWGDHRQIWPLAWFHYLNSLSSELSHVLQSWISFFFIRKTSKLFRNRLPSGVWLIKHNGMYRDPSSKSQRASDISPNSYWWQIIKQKEEKPTPHPPTPNLYLLYAMTFKKKWSRIDCSVYHVKPSVLLL